MAQSTLFVDTSYILALYNTRDQWHSNTVDWQLRIEKERPNLVITEFIFIEIADALSARNLREDAARIVRSFMISGEVYVAPADSTLFSQGLELYEKRSDKDWGLTDCTSFVVMRERNIFAALTADAHYVQAGFEALLLR